MVRWLELSADYECNNRCVGCFSVQPGGARMDSREALENLALGRREGAKWLWVGGGEPTLRRDLVGLVQAARRLGYTRVRLQTNGMLLAYPDFVRRLAEAGVTEVSFSIKGPDAPTHDRLARTEGAFELMTRGIAECARLGLGLEGDVLVYRESADRLAETVRVFAGLGLSRFNVWLFSAADQGGEDLGAHVPRISDVMRQVSAARALGLSERPDFITSLHTPACTVPEADKDALFFARDLDLLVTDPGGRPFRLEQSPIEGGTYLERCGGCAMRARCAGIRADYLRVHGEAEFQPLAGPRLPAVRAMTEDRP